MTLKICLSLSFFLFTVHWTVGSHPLGGCSLSNLYPISPTKVLTRKLLHIKRNGLGLWRRMQSLSNLWVCLKYDVAPLWDQCKRTFKFTTRSLYPSVMLEGPLETGKREKNWNFCPTLLLVVIMCNEKQRRTWIHHSLGLFVDKWLAALRIRKYHEMISVMFKLGCKR